MKRFTSFMLMLLCAVVTFAQAELPAEGTFFRLKNTTSQLYMTVNSYNSNNQNDGGIVISAKNTEDLSKQVFRLVKHEDAYHLLTFNNNVISTFASWGFRAEPGYSNAALIIEESTDDIWKLKGTKGYIGTNNGETSDGSTLYSNHDAGKQNIYWAFEAVTEEEATAAAAEVVPTSISSLINNNSCYTITAYEANRGSWYSAEDALTSTYVQNVDKNAEDVCQQFAFIQKDGKYYLYSVAKKMFVAKNGNHTKYTKTAEDFVTFENATVASYAAPYVIALNGKNHMGISNGYTPAVITSYNSTSDGGNAVCIVRAGAFDPAEALGTFNTKATVTYEFQYKEKTLATQEVAAVKGAAYPDFVAPVLPFGYVVTGSKPDGTVEGNATVQITLGIDDSKVPFKFVAEGTQPTTWYYAQMHAYPGYHWYVAPAADGASVKTQDHKFTEDEIKAHLWGFIGTVEGGFKMVNKDTGDAIKSNNDGVAAMASVADATAFIAMPSSNNGWLCLRHPDGKYLNSQSNVIKHWDDNGNGSSFYLTEYVDEDVTVNVSELGWATKYFGESVYVPADVNAYIITGVENGWITKSQIAEGEVIPANTGVLLENAGEYNFAKTVSYNYTLAGNLLDGSVENTYVEGTAYVLANHNETVGFYKAELNKDAEGKEGKTHFLNNAGKAYLVLPAEKSAAYYGFDWDGTTEIENVVVENEVKVIYDLTGRRVEAITTAGIYIVNGKKVLVK